MARMFPKRLRPKDGSSSPEIAQWIDKLQIRQAPALAQWHQDYAAFDDVLGAQQRAFYADRRSVLFEPDMRPRTISIINQVMTAEVEGALRSRTSPDALMRKLRALCPGAAPARMFVESAMRGGTGDRGAKVVSAVLRAVHQAYSNRETEIGKPMREVERRILLTVSDRAWRGHLEAMSDVRSELMIRGATGSQGLAEYQRRAGTLYTEMTAQIRLHTVGNLFNLTFEVQG